ncbi:MAG: hypothetical protein ABSH32_09170 [Bryobacteraceae bacterium]|jgi:hypothetical protein
MALRSSRALPGGDRALPNLAENIRCGNSLIGADYFAGNLIVDIEGNEAGQPA